MWLHKRYEVALKGYVVRQTLWSATKGLWWDHSRLYVINTTGPIVFAQDITPLLVCGANTVTRLWNWVTLPLTTKLVILYINDSATCSKNTIVSTPFLIIYCIANLLSKCSSLIEKVWSISKKYVFRSNSASIL